MQAGAHEVDQGIKIAKIPKGAWNLASMRHVIGSCHFVAGSVELTRITHTMQH